MGLQTNITTFIYLFITSDFVDPQKTNMNINELGICQVLF